MRFMADRPRRAPSPTAYDAAFGQTLLSPDRPQPSCVAGPGGKAAVKRFNVYRNNVTHSLVTALTEIYPVVTQILGEQNFRMIARDFVRAHPPTSKLVLEYGRGFAEHLADFDPIRHLRYLPDVARLERAWLDAYHAADRAPLDPAEFAALPPQALAEIRLSPHPAMHVIESDYAIHTIFAAHRSGPMPGRIDAGIPEAVLISRPLLRVEIRKLARGQPVFFKALRKGAPLRQAASLAMEQDPSFDLVEAIGLTIESGAFSGSGFPPPN